MMLIKHITFTENEQAVVSIELNGYYKDGKGDIELSLSAKSLQAKYELSLKFNKGGDSPEFVLLHDYILNEKRTCPELILEDEQGKIVKCGYRFGPVLVTKFLQHRYISIYIDYIYEVI